MTVANAENFGVRQPASHYRQATCEEIACIHYEQGWHLYLPLNPKCDHLHGKCDGLKCHMPEVLWIRAGGSKREFKELPQEDPLIFAFSFKAEQKCFRWMLHRVPKGMSPILIRQIGGNILTLDWDEWSTTFNERVEKANQLRKAG